MIPFANPRAQYLSYKQEIDGAIARVLESGRYILGNEVGALEAEFAAYIGCRFGVGVGSGTEALHMALWACGIGPGDEVITIPHTAVATVAAIELCGATPVLVDIEPDYYTLNPAHLKSAITSRTKGVIPVHLYGQAANLSLICEIAKEAGVAVIEDCAQAHGTTYHGRRAGSFGDISCFSFYPTKNLGAIGDGGIVLTNQPNMAGRLRLLREYGWRARYVSEIPGSNSRLDELQAAILRVKLQYLDGNNQKRIALAQFYNLELLGSSVTLPPCRPGTDHTYHLYVIRSTRRDALQAFLKENGVDTLIHYPIPIHLQPAYRGRLGDEGSFPETERAAGEVLSLPMYPELIPDQVSHVCKTIHRFNAREE